MPLGCVQSKVTRVTVYVPSFCGSARSTSRLSSSSTSVLSQLPSLTGLVNQMRPLRSIARSFGVLSFLPSMRSATTTFLPSGSKRTIARPPEQQPKSRPFSSNARPLVRLVPSRQSLDRVRLEVVAQDAVLADLREKDVLAVPYRTFGDAQLGLRFRQQLEFPGHLCSSVRAFLRSAQGASMTHHPGCGALSMHLTVQ